MIGPAQVHQLLRTLAAQPVLPSMDQLPANDESLHALLADLAGGERSRYAEMVSHIATEAQIAPEELARRAEFLLACLILPGSGSYYEMLGVAPTATPAEIRQRWATLIQRYHPDHFERSDGWVTDQARRLIEAYQTLRDPERRRHYDAALAQERAAVTEQRRSGSASQTPAPQVVSTPPAAVVSVKPDQTVSRVSPHRVAPAEDDPLRLIENFRDAYERKDLGAMMRLFASSPREQEAVGRSAVQALYARNFDALDQIYYDLTRLETMAPASNDTLVVRGWFRIRAVRRDNPSQLVDAAGPVRWLLRREANTLRIAEIDYELSRP